MGKQKQIDKLLKIKQLRRRLAELEVAKANRAVTEAEGEVDNARANEQYVRDHSDERRQKRLTDLMDASKNPSVQNARVSNVYAMTDFEIKQSQEIVIERLGELEHKQTCAKTEQAKLARFLQLEERTNKLCERVISKQKMENARKA